MDDARTACNPGTTAGWEGERPGYDAAGIVCSARLRAKPEPLCIPIRWIGIFVVQGLAFPATRQDGKRAHRA